MTAPNIVVLDAVTHGNSKRIMALYHRRRLTNTVWFLRRLHRGKLTVASGVPISHLRKDGVSVSQFSIRPGTNLSHLRSVRYLGKVNDSYMVYRDSVVGEAPDTKQLWTQTEEDLIKLILNRI